MIPGRSRRCLSLSFDPRDLLLPVCALRSARGRRSSVHAVSGLGNFPRVALPPGGQETDMGRR